MTSLQEFIWEHRNEDPAQLALSANKYPGVPIPYVARQLDALAKVRALAVGTWVELVDGNGESQRAKLIWNSAISQRCLFVNRNGQMTADRSYQNVASEWMLGHVKPIEDGALFERALVAVKRRLVDAQSSRAA